MSVKIVYDPTLSRPACAILQAALGGDEGIANRFPTEQWLISPTPDMGLYEVTQEQLDQLVAIAMRPGMTLGAEGRYAEGALYWRPLDDGYEITVYAMTYGKARLCYGEQGEMGGILNGYCYADPARAIEAAKIWDGEGDPLDGWHRNPFDGRRREGGDPAKEHKNW